MVVFMATLLPCHSETILTGRSMTSRDGLLSNQVNDMVQDANGYIWLGTSSGLCRYDGYSFVNFQSIGYGNAQTNGSIGTLHVDTQNGLMWMRTATFNYACYDLHRGCFVDYLDGQDPRRTFDRFITENNGMWMYEANYGIRHVAYANGVFKCKDYTAAAGSMPNVRVKKIIADAAGHIWAITDNGLLRLNAAEAFDHMAKGNCFMVGNVWKDKVFFLTDKGRVFVYDTRGRLVKDTAIPSMMGTTAMVNGNIVWQDKWLIMTREAVMSMNLTSFVFERPQDIQMAYGLPLDNINGNYWVADYNGSLWFFPAKGSVRKFKLLDEKGVIISRKRNFSTIQGKDGCFYIATYGNGLFVFNPADDAMTHYTAADKQPLIATDYLTNIHSDRDGNIWIGQEDAGIVCMQRCELPKTMQLTLEPGRQGGKSNFITKMTMRDDGTVAIGTRNLHRYIYKPQDNSVTKVGTENESDNRLDSITDKYGHTWIATWEQGLQMKYKEKTQVFLERNTAESRINDMTIDKQGRLWVATFNGLYVTDTGNKNFSDNSFRHFNREDGIMSDEINCIVAASDGTVWAGGVGTGVMKCTLGKDGSIDIDNTTAKRGLAYDNIYAMTEDEHGNIWASSEAVISRIAPKTMKVTNYHVGTTLLNGIYSPRCALTLNDGRIMFGTHDGITVIMPPATVSMVKPHSKALVTNIEINGHSVFYDEKYTAMRGLDGRLSLANDENSLTIHFSSLDYARADQVTYQFWMEGLDKTWSEPSTLHSAEYGSLPPGHYVFHLRTTDGGEETTLHITIHEPWYNTWWAWLCYICLLSVAAYVIYHYKREELKRKQQLAVEKKVAEFRTNFFTQVVHEFRTPLAIISGAVDKMTEEGSTQRKPMQTTRRGVKRLTQLVNRLMEFRKIDSDNLRLQVEKGDLVGFVRDIQQDLWTNAQQKEQTLTFLSSEKQLETVFDHHIIDTIVYNLVSNAVKYTPQKGTIMVKLKTEEDAIRLTVEDSGQGIDTEKQKKLFQPFMHGYASQGGMGIGLYTAYKMALTHKGMLTYSRSEALGGAMFTLMLPADTDVYALEDYRDSTVTDKSETVYNKQAEQIIMEMLPQALNDHRIAIIEDDPDMLEQIKEEVAVYFHVDAYSTGNDGYEGLLNSKPALLICDVMLPDMSGYDIVKKMRKHDTLKDIPVIMLTALGDEQHQIRGYEAGADDYMVKPCNYRILIARAIQLIKWSSRHDALVNRVAEATDVTTARVETPAALPTSEKPLITSSADKHLLERINTLVAQNISNPDFNIDLMADIMHMGRTKLYGKVRELTGLSPNKLLMTERMRMAAELLERSDLNISEIGYKVGILDASYFNKCFKQHFGTSPSKYRKER